ncbi:MAG: hypothetical protein LBC19_16815 [Tannerella sp.]|jgi:hypothetical protein|nr:hypothetical protein [Tannerella sp.]
MTTRTVLLHAFTLCITIAGCSRTDDGRTPPAEPSGLIVKALQPAVVTMAGDGTDVERVIFTGDDILWFNGSTKEIRFKNNISQKKIIEGVLSRTIRFYIDGEYLFSSMICVSDLNSQTFDSPVFYYSQIENMFYLNDGYPDVSVLQNKTEHQNRRDENMAEIRDEWDKFIARLKLEDKWIDGI